MAGSLAGRMCRNQLISKVYSISYLPSGALTISSEMDEVTRALARQAHNLEVGGSNPPPRNQHNYNNVSTAAPVRACILRRIGSFTDNQKEVVRG